MKNKFKDQTNSLPVISLKSNQKDPLLFSLKLYQLEPPFYSIKSELGICFNSTKDFIMTSMEALKSTDPRAVKYARRAVKGQVTMGATRLTNLLQKTTDGKFDFDNISYPVVSEVYTKLMSDFGLITQLHDRYVQIRDEGQDDDEEDKLVQEETQYMLNVSTQIDTVLGVYMKYDKSFKQQEKMQEKRGKSETGSRQQKDSYVQCQRSSEPFIENSSK